MPRLVPSFTPRALYGHSELADDSESTYRPAVTRGVGNNRTRGVIYRVRPLIQYHRPSGARGRRPAPASSYLTPHDTNCGASRNNEGSDYDAPLDHIKTR